MRHNIWLKTPDQMTSWEFFDYLLHEIQVVGTPGEGFGACGEGYFRFSTFGSPEDTKEAAERLVKLLSKVRKEVQEMFDAGKVTKDCIDWTEIFLNRTDRTVMQL